MFSDTSMQVPVPASAKSGTVTMTTTSATLWEAISATRSLTEIPQNTMRTADLRWKAEELTAIGRPWCLKDRDGTYWQWKAKENRTLVKCPGFVTWAGCRRL